MNKRLLLIGLLLLIITNVVILTRVAYNRAAEVAMLQLTERELPKVYRNMRDNSAKVLRLKWQTSSLTDSSGYHTYYQRLPVSDSERQALGLEQSCEQGNYRGSSEERKAWVLMELDGKHYHNEVRLLQAKVDQKQKDLQLLLAHNSGTEGRDAEQQKLKQLQQQLDRLQHEESRLYAIAVAAEAKPLMLAIKGKDNQFVVRGTVKDSYYCDNTVRISQLFIDRLYVEKDVLPETDLLPRRYNVEVAIGNLGEAWITQLKPR